MFLAVCVASLDLAAGPVAAGRDPSVEPDDTRYEFAP